MSRHHDTIAALATPTGTSAIAVLRISGPDTSRLVTGLIGAPPAPRAARHVDYRERGGAVIDDVLLTFFAGPRSYTGEDACEIACHGNPFIAQKILEDLLARGCRAAEPGEFTQRAFLHGKMDLSQAEAVMDLIHARSERALAVANQQLRGELSRRLQPLVESLLGVLARIEAYIDFPDEDLPLEDVGVVRREIERIIFDTNRLAATSRFGDILRDGIKTVILGAPNAGKSSLLNQLVGKERALVSAEPGTTRDFIEEPILVGPHLVRLIDTAGLNPAPERLEGLGIRKTLERAAEADLVLFVVDASLPSPPPISTGVASLLSDKAVIVVRNKSDLVSTRTMTSVWPDAEHVWVSAATGDGLEALRAVITAKGDSFAADPSDLITINARHAQALSEVRASLESTLAKLASAEPTELLASDLRAALDAFGAITGRIDNERMLDQLFATFCIGK